MKSKRIIRFQDGAVEKIEIQQKLDTVVENVENLAEESKKDIAVSQLIECAKRILSGAAPNNLIGVFGRNSNVVISDFRGKLRGKEIKERLGILQWIGTVKAPIQPIKEEIYNVLAEEFYYHWKECEKSDEDDEIITLLNKVIVSEEHFITDNTRRSIDLTEAIMKIRDKEYYLADHCRDIYDVRQNCYIKDIHDNRRRRYRGFLIAIKMERMNYEILFKLKKLRDPNLIIIVSSLLDYNSAARSFEDIAGNMGTNMMNKFFSIDNCIDAS